VGNNWIRLGLFFVVLVSLPIIYTLVFKAGCIIGLEDDEKIDECYEGKLDAIVTTFGFIVGVPILALGSVWALCALLASDPSTSSDGGSGNEYSQNKTCTKCGGELRTQGLIFKSHYCPRCCTLCGGTNTQSYNSRAQSWICSFCNQIVGVCPNHGCRSNMTWSDRKFGGECYTCHAQDMYGDDL